MEALTVKFYLRTSASGYDAQPRLMAELSSGLLLRIGTKGRMWHLLTSPCCHATFKPELDRARRRICTACGKPVAREVTGGPIGEGLEGLFQEFEPLTAVVAASALADRLRSLLAVDHERYPQDFLQAMRSESGDLL